MEVVEPYMGQTEFAMAFAFVIIGVALIMAVVDYLKIKDE